MSGLYDIPLHTLEGKPASLRDYAGKVLLVVNVASKCGLTPQYEGLEALYRARKGEGLVVLGFPANNFAGQEPGTAGEIAAFCSLTYDVTFPMFSKISVKGPDRHPLYDLLTAVRPEAEGDKGLKQKLLGMFGAGQASDVTWNFEKFVVGRDGEVAGRFSPDTKPDDPALLAAIDQELAKAV